MTSPGPGKRPHVPPDRARVIANLQALIAALDRRVPHIERAGERQIAHDAGLLRQKALKRLEALREQGE